MEWNRKLLSLVFVAVLSSVALSQDKTIPPYEIVSVKAFLFFNHDGTFSENIIDNPDIGLFNVFIGGGGIKGPSHSTMVLVEISGRAESYDGGMRKIQFTAVERRHTKLNKVTAINIIGDNGRYFEAFWLYDTGVNPIDITVKIIGQSEEREVKTKIDFQSGE
jgi:hypothetical protein